MFQYRKIRLLFVVLASLAFGASAGLGRPPAIEDHGAFFSGAAKAEADRYIGELDRTVKKDLAIETLKELPEDIRQGLNLQDKAAVSQALDDWATRQAKAKGLNGVYILLVKSPAHLRVMVGDDTRKQAFTLRDRDTLVAKMLTKLRAKDYDGALLDGVNFVSVTMRANATGGTGTAVRHPAAPVQSSESSFSIISVLIVVLVIWVVIGIFRALFRRGGAGGPAMSPLSGGGGFFGSLMGGLFGAAAGMWMHDHFFGGNASASDAGHGNLENSDPGFTGQDTDYSGSGDTFGDSSGDSGGGDFGGGDSGGGDF